ncbi:deferrochelatase/peroxidase EfeB [Neisseria perflava]|nr:deferrochelatase/peroxidase EfeB [Neisseria perflava]
MNPQTAIIPDHCKSGVFIEADIRIGQEAAVKAACRKSLEALAQLQSRFPDAALDLTIAFGSEAWKVFGHTAEGSEIKPFRPLGNGLAPAT